MKKTAKKFTRKKILNPINLICWIIIPLSIIGIMVLDGLEFYCLNTERLIVIGAGIIVLLIPFFSEIKIKNFTIKK